MNSEGTDRLSEYLDGELDSQQAAALEARLAAEPELRRVLDELRAVRRAAADHPDFEAPPQLWRAVRERIEPVPAGGRRSAAVNWRSRLLFTLPQLAAAAGVVLLLGFSLGRMSDQATGRTAGDRITQRPAVSDLVDATTQGGRPRYAQFVADLESRLDTGRDGLEPGTAQVIEESLAKIDAAITRARTALEADPNNVYLNQHLASAQWRKLRLLEDATTLIASRT